MRIQIDEAAKTIDVQGTFTLSEVAKWMQDKYPDTWEEYKLVQPIGQITYGGCWGCWGCNKNEPVLIPYYTTNDTHPNTTVTFTQN